MRFFTSAFAASLLGATALSCLPAPALAQDVGDIIETEQAEARLVEVASGLEFPWSIAFLPDGGALVSEREGRLRVIENDTLRDAPVSGLPDILVERQGGLLGLALHPDFEDNRYVYFAYSSGEASANRTTLGRGRLSEDLSELTDVEEVFRVNFNKERGFHFGGRIVFLEDGTLLLTLGDGGLYRDESQNNDNHLGAIVRLDDDGSIPFDNPFRSVAGARPEIWSFGHRNVQGIAIQPDTGAVFAHEHGARGGDEINIIRSGENYGWPLVTYGVNYNGSIISEETSREGLVEPVWYWVPSIAPSGLAFHNGETFPDWEGDLFVGALAGSMLVRYELDGDRIISEERLLEEFGRRIRDVATAPNGDLYLLTDDLDGQVLRLESPG